MPFTTFHELEVPLYSDSDSDDVELKRKRKNWMFSNKFSCISDAEEVVNAEKTWSIVTTHATVDGKKRYYRCNKVRRRGVQCSAAIFLLFESDSSAVLLYRTDCDHDHDSIENNYNFGISKEIKAEISKLFELHLKPKAILECLKKSGVGVPSKLPSKRQVNNYLADLRRSKYGPERPEFTIHLGDLEDWITRHTKIPENENEAFVISHYIFMEKEPPSFRFVLTSKNLLKQCCAAEILHVDTTNKLLWQGFPVSIVGTTDKTKKFHPICMLVSAQENAIDFKMMFEELKNRTFAIFSHVFEPKILVCDEAKSIQDAFTEVFGEGVAIRLCWAHTKKKMCSIIDQFTEAQFRNYILQDINELQSLTFPEVFLAATKAFLSKWKNQRAFVEYFRQEWVVKNPNWYLGAAPVSPETNNALKSFVQDIKGENIFRERIPLARFLEVVEEMIKDWSQKAIEENFAKEPVLQISDWRTGQRWAQADNKVTTVQSSPTSCTYLIPIDGHIEHTQFMKIFKHYDVYKQFCLSSWTVTLPVNIEWSKCRCNCPDFYHEYICKHVIGLAIRMKYVTPPVEEITLNNGLKRKRGRPPKGRPALIVK